MTDDRNIRSNRFLVPLVVVLLAAVAVQSYLLIRMVWKGAGIGDAQAEAPTLTLVPNATAAPPAPSAPARTPALSAPAPFGLDRDDWGWGPAADDWNPFAEMQRMREQMSRLFDDAFGRFQASPGFSDQWDSWSFAPSLDLEEQGDDYVVRLNVPGADKSNLSVNLDDRLLRISGQVDEITEESDGHQVLRKERRSGQFERALTLPGPVDADRMTADYENGVLTVHVPKAEGPRSGRTITI